MSRIFELLQRVDKERAAGQMRESEKQREQLQSQLITEPPAAAAHASVPESIPAEQLCAPLEIDAPARDEISKLVQRLFLLSGASKVVAFAAIEPGNGCTWLTSRTGDVLAGLSGARVCLIDGNFRSPGLNDCFGVQNGYGLTDAMMDGSPIRKFMRPLSRGNFWLLSGGSMVSNGHVIMGSELLRGRIAELRANFDFILIDAPALTQGGDAIVWGHLADGVVLVLGANSTHRETARWAATDLAAANVRVLGGVLNKRTFPVPEKLYNKL